MHLNVAQIQQGGNIVFDGLVLSWNEIRTDFKKTNLSMRITLVLRCSLMIHKMKWHFLSNNDELSSCPDFADEVGKKSCIFVL